ncbi:phospholipase/carboxylesterase [Rhodopirellula rubra]|uniref:Phospholipase/carboxylesterase n=1 Tax=Aporhodopirellula rubra TaxID=980271 RepID=A0A7W5H527_9BACT|nr:lysophospholipase [Aporhodopirellula rubra]MBB3205989.1 phospholipase/carboxylesterase [Aporhodopirellula rubra]
MNNPNYSADGYAARPRVETIGPLRCLVVDGSEDARIPVILCHGYGAPGDDLASLTPHLIEWIGTDSGALRFIYPEAPHDLSDIGMPEGRAWWPLNMMALQELLQTNRFDELHDQVPPGIDEARAALEETVTQVLADVPEGTPYVLGGFSQGAMLTMDLALRGSVRPPNILVQFSGTLVCESLWKSKLDRLADTHVLQSHGRIDPILPFSSAEALRDMLRGGNTEVEFMAFQGPHTIETDTLFRLVERLRLLAVSTKQ